MDYHHELLELLSALPYFELVRRVSAVMVATALLPDFVDRGATSEVGAEFSS